MAFFWALVEDGTLERIRDEGSELALLMVVVLMPF